MEIEMIDPESFRIVTRSAPKKKPAPPPPFTKEKIARMKAERAKVQRFANLAAAALAIADHDDDLRDLGLGPVLDSGGLRSDMHMAKGMFLIVKDKVARMHARLVGRVAEIDAELAADRARRGRGRR